MKSTPYRTLLVLLSLGVMLAPAVALADGGTVQAIQDSDGLIVSVFTSPAILSAGEVDISVLVQHAESHPALVNADVQVTVIPREHVHLAERHAATAELATNRLMKACHLQLEPGWHDVKVQVSDQGRRSQVDFAMLVGPIPTKAASFWPWFTWPAIPIALVAANLVYRRTRSRRSVIIHSSKAHLARTTPVSR
jgi:hypothetical protein